MPSSSTPAAAASPSQPVSFFCRAAICFRPAMSGACVMNVPTRRPAVTPRNSSSRYAFITVSGFTASVRVTSLIRGSWSPSRRKPRRSA